MKKTLDAIMNLIINICAIFLASIVVIVAIQIVSRRLGMSVSWTDELARYCYIAFCFVGWSVAALYGNDIVITTLFDLFPMKVRKVVLSIYLLMMVATASALFYGMYRNTINAGVILSTTMRWFQMRYLYYVVLAGLGMTVIMLLIRLVRVATGKEAILTDAERNNIQIEKEQAKATILIEKIHHQEEIAKMHHQDEERGKK